MGFSRQESWSGLPCPPPGDLPNPGIEPASLTSNLHWQVGSLPLALLGKPLLWRPFKFQTSGECLFTLPLGSTSLPLNPGDHHLHSAPDKLLKLQRQFFRANCLERRGQWWLSIRTWSMSLTSGGITQSCLTLCNPLHLSFPLHS